MKITERRSDDGTIDLTVTATKAEMAQQFKNCSIVLAQKNGIQPEMGKTPMDSLAAKLGKPIALALLKDEIMSSLTPRACQEKGIHTVGMPTCSADTEPDAGKEWTFQATVVEMPSIELDSYEPVEVSVKGPQVDEKSIDAAMREQASQMKVPVTDDSHDTVENGDMLELNMTVICDGAEVEALGAKGRTYQTGKNLMPDGFDENLNGMKVGETKTFDFEGPNFQKGASDGEFPVDTFTATVEILRLLKEEEPTIDDAWVSSTMPQFSTVEQWRSALAAQAQAAEEFRHRRNQACASELAKRVDVPIADAVYEACFREMEEELSFNLRQAGMSREQFMQQQGLNQQQMSMQMMMQVREMLTQQLAIDALARHLKLQIEDGDITEFFHMIAPGNELMARQSYQASGHMAEAEEAALRLKANDWLSEHSTVHAI